MGPQLNSSIQKARNNFTIKPFYTTSELKNLLGYKRTQTAKRFLLKLKVPCNQVGGKDIWYLTDLQTYSPDLFYSLCEAANLNNLIAKPISIQDLENYTSNQLKS